MHRQRGAVGAFFLTWATACWATDNTISLISPRSFDADQIFRNTSATNYTAAGFVPYGQGRIHTINVTGSSDGGNRDVIVTLRPDNDTVGLSLYCTGGTKPSFSSGAGTWASAAGLSVNQVFISKNDPSYNKSKLENTTQPTATGDPAPTNTFTCVVAFDGKQATVNSISYNLGTIIGVPTQVSLTPIEQTTLKSLFTRCCSSDDSCAKWKSWSNGSSVATDFCKVPGQICTPTGNLYRLDLSNNSLSCPWPADLLSQFRQLSNLDLQNSSFTGASSAVFPTLSNMNLQYLDLSNSMAPDSASANGTLIDSGATRDALCKMTQTASSRRSLKFLSLAGMDLAGSVPDCLYTDGSTLVTLDLGDNHISGSLPDTFANASNLRVLSISNNSLTGTLPASLIRAKNLGMLYLTGNRLKGTIPDAYGELKSLQYFWVSRGQLSGKIPEGFGVAPSLRSFSVYSNNLTTLPGAWTNASTNSTNSSLAVVKLAYNNITGPFPAGLVKFPVLETLHLKNNTFRGPLPENISTTLYDLNVTFNQLTGTIPAGLFTGKFSNATVAWMDVSHNQLNGSLPAVLHTAPIPQWARTGLQLQGNPGLSVGCKDASLAYIQNFSNFCQPGLPAPAPSPAVPLTPQPLLTPPTTISATPSVPEPAPLLSATPPVPEPAPLLSATPSVPEPAPLLSATPPAPAPAPGVPSHAPAPVPEAPLPAVQSPNPPLVSDAQNPPTPQPIPAEAPTAPPQLAPSIAASAGRFPVPSPAPGVPLPVAKSSSISGSALAGIAAGAVGGVAVVGVVAFLVLRKKAKSARTRAEQSFDDPKVVGGHTGDSVPDVESLGAGKFSLGWKAEADLRDIKLGDPITTAHLPALPDEERLIIKSQATLPPLPVPVSRDPTLPVANTWSGQSNNRPQPGKQQREGEQAPMSWNLRVAEIPTPHATATAQTGAQGSIRILGAPTSGPATTSHAASTGTSSQQALSISPAASKRSLGTNTSSLDSRLSLSNDWQLSAEEIAICKDERGDPFKLGTGAYGSVYKATIDGVIEVAVKIFHEAHSSKEQVDMLREVAILKGCRDRHIVNFLGACILDGKVLLVTEYMEAGDLWHALQLHHRNVLCWYQKGKDIAIQVARGLHYLHRKKIIHFDLKSANILLTRGGDAKISDVGFASILTNSHISNAGGYTFAWAAPEILMGAACTEKADIFSYGVVLWEIVTGEQPKRGMLRETKVPEECPAQVEALIQSCLAFNPEDRPTCREIVEVLG